MSDRVGMKRSARTLPCVLLDVNTQNDFLADEGRCPVKNRELLVPALRRTVAWAKRNQVPVISSLDCHRMGELRNARMPQHCVDGTSGQEKIDFTLYGTYVQVEGDNTLAVPIDLFRKYQQVIFRKRTVDFFLNPKADRFVSQLPAAEYVIAGLGIEGSVKAIALGLIARCKRVTVVVDACGYFDRSEAELTVRLLAAKGAELITVDQLLSRRLPRPTRYPNSRRGNQPAVTQLQLPGLKVRTTHASSNGQSLNSSPSANHGASPGHGSANGNGNVAFG
jgi:nicotinamidase-related amidase